MEKPDSAIQDFSRALEKDSLNSYTLFNRSLAWSKKSDHAKALADLDRVILLSPYNSYAYYNRAIAWIQIGNRKKGISDFKMVSRLDPKNIISYYYSSRLEYELQQYQAALEDLDKTIQLYPEYTDAWYDRYLVKLKLNDKKGAQEDLRRVEELRKINQLTPDSIRKSKENYLKSLVKLSGDFNDMNTLNSKFQNQDLKIDLMPMYREVNGRADFESMQVYDAYRKKNYYTHFIILSTQDSPMNDTLVEQRIDSIGQLADPGKVGNFLMGSAYLEQKKFDSAIDRFNRVLRADSLFIAAYFGRANARFQLIQKFQDEIEQSENVTIGITDKKKEQPPENTTIHTLDSVLYDLSMVTRLDSTFQYGFYNRGYINTKMGNYKNAVADFSKALDLDPSMGNAWYARGLINILLKNEQEGCSDLSHAGEMGLSEAFRVMKRYCYRY
ncbi:MAG: tetratricopeptide repeat protein, partial [Syntrophothermus sp.]